MVKVNEQEVLEIIYKALNLKDKKILTYKSSINDIEEWDSLGHLGILSALDKFYGGRIASVKEMAGADSVEKILQILKKYSFVDSNNEIK